MGVIVDRLEKNDRIYDPLTYIYVARSWDEFISNSYFFFPLVRRRSRKEKEKEKKKEIVHHPIVAIGRKQNFLPIGLYKFI